MHTYLNPKLSLNSNPQTHKHNKKKQKKNAGSHKMDVMRQIKTEKIGDLPRAYVNAKATQASENDDKVYI